MVSEIAVPAVGGIVEKIATKRLELRTAEQAAQRVHVLRQEILILERAKLILEGGSLPEPTQAHVSTAGPWQTYLNHARRNLFTGNSAASYEPTDKSFPELVRDALVEAHKPLSIDEIMAKLSENANGKELSRSSVMGSIYRAAKHERIFKLVKPGVFGLLEWMQPGEEDAS